MSFITVYFGMVSMTSASRYVTSPSRYQSRSSMYIRGLIPRNYTELAEAVSIAFYRDHYIMAKLDLIQTLALFA